MYTRIFGSRSNSTNIHTGMLDRDPTRDAYISTECRRSVCTHMWRTVDRDPILAVYKHIIGSRSKYTDIYDGVLDRDPTRDACKPNDRQRSSRTHMRCPVDRDPNLTMYTRIVGSRSNYTSIHTRTVDRDPTRDMYKSIERQVYACTRMCRTVDRDPNYDNVHTYIWITIHRSTCPWSYSDRGPHFGT